MDFLRFTTLHKLCTHFSGFFTGEVPEPVVNQRATQSKYFSKKMRLA